MNSSAREVCQLLGWTTINFRTAEMGRFGSKAKQSCPYDMKPREMEGHFFCEHQIQWQRGICTFQEIFTGAEELIFYDNPKNQSLSTTNFHHLHQYEEQGRAFMVWGLLWVSVGTQMAFCTTGCLNMAVPRRANGMYVNERIWSVHYETSSWNVREDMVSLSSCTMKLAFTSQWSLRLLWKGWVEINNSSAIFWEQCPFTLMIDTIGTAEYSRPKMAELIRICNCKEYFVEAVC